MAKMKQKNQTRTGPTTRGGLVPGKLTNLVTNTAVNFMFNPEAYSLSKSNEWEKKVVTGQNLPRVIFKQGGAQSLTLKLHFDSQHQGYDVRSHTDPLWKMMMIDNSTENSSSGKGTPPPVAFEWGGVYFKAIITTMSQNFTLFDSKGTPLRCEVNITLEQFLDIQPQPQTQGASSTTAPQSETVTEGDRLDHVASRSTGDASNYRSVAEANNIDNPQALRNGQKLNVG